MGQFMDSDEYTPTEILSSSHGAEVRRAITIASGAGVLVKGQILGQYNSGVNSGTFNIYNNALSDGREVAIGILADKVDATASGVQSTMYTHGEFYEERLTGTDATALSDLKNCVFVNEE